MTATIENLEVGLSTHFQLRHKRLTSAAIERLFNQLRSQSRKPSPNLFRHVREVASGGIFSAICFSYERGPSFLDVEVRVFDRVHGFLLIIERGDYVAVLKSGLDLPARFRTDYFRRADRDRVEAAVATAEAIFERLRVQSTSPSKQLLRSKTLKAATLKVRCRWRAQEATSPRLMPSAARTVTSRRRRAPAGSQSAPAEARMKM